MIKVLIVDDEHLVRLGLRTVLEADDRIEVVAEAANGADAVRCVHAHRPDVVLMDIRMPTMDGLAATRELSRGPDAPQVIVLTTFDLDDYVHSALRAGAAGFLLKETRPRELIAAVHTVADGNAILAPAVTRRLLTEFANGDHQRARRATETLTERERAVLRLLGQGMSNLDIAAKLFVSEPTVKAHVSRILTKLNAANRVQAAIVAHEAGLLRH